MVKETADALFPTYARFPITLVKGKGSRVWDDQGKEYVDFMCGLAVTNLGHAPERVKEQLEHQLDELWHVSNLFHIPGQERLADKLCSISGLDRVFFCSTGQRPMKRLSNLPAVIHGLSKERIAMRS